MNILYLNMLLIPKHNDQGLIELVGVLTAFFKVLVKK